MKPKKKMDDKGRTRAIYLPHDLDRRIDALRKKMDRSYSYVAAKLLQSGVEAYEQFPFPIESRPVRRKESVK